MPSLRAIQIGRHPFPFLLYGEWGIIGMALLSEFAPNFSSRGEGLHGAAAIAMLAFGLLGFWLPLKPLGLQIAHMGLQLALIMLAARLGTAGLRLFPLLYVVLVLRSCLMFGWWGRLLVTSVAFMLFLSTVQRRLRPWERDLSSRLEGRLLPPVASVRLNFVVMFLLLLVFLLLLMNALLAERERREELRQANQKLRDSAVQIERLAMNQERTRIAREIHDSLGHALTGLNIQLEGALKLWETQPEQAKTFVTQAKEMGSTALQETRQAVATLRQTPSSQQEIASAIAPLIQRLTQVTGIVPDMQVAPLPLPESLTLTVYRIVQEALTNIYKYAQASQVSIKIQRSPVAPQLHITVKDNGVGFNPQDNTTGYGLRGIQERAEAEGGQLQIMTAPGQGCTVHVWLPLPLEAT